MSDPTTKRGPFPDVSTVQGTTCRPRRGTDLLSEQGPADRHEAETAYGRKAERGSKALKVSGIKSNSVCVCVCVSMKVGTQTVGFSNGS